MLRYRSTNLSQTVLQGNKSTVMEKTLTLNQNLQKRRNSLIWGIANALLLGLVGYDLSYKCSAYTTWFNCLEYFAVFVFSLNTLYHVSRYLYFTLKTESVVVTPSQKRLLGFKDTDSYYKVCDKGMSTPVTPQESLLKTPDNSLQCTPLNWSALSWRTNSTTNDSQNYSMSSPSWVYYHGSPDNRPSPNTTPAQKLQFPDTSGVDFITDEKSLKQYLLDYEHYEKAHTASNPPEQTSNLLSSFWSHPVTQSPNEVSPFLKRNQYQLASQITSTVSSPSGISDESRTALNISTLGTEIWRKLQIDPHSLIQWNANLRLWLSQTILDRLVTEINLVNEEFVKLHLNDVRVGNVGLERLRKTAQTMPVIQYVPTLTALLPFLEVTPNQEYLVKRIKELAKGGCMSEYKWNSGGSYNGKEWEDSLVTDSEIIIHFLATYLDSQLLPLPNQPDAKPFSKEHFIRPLDKVPQNPLTLAIHQATEKPPHFRLIVGEEVFEVVKGHNNLLYTILLFLHFVNKKEHGMLGKVNMGRSGVNMLWIIDGN